MSYASDALIDALQRENDQLKAENAKLEGLVLDALSFVLACVWHLNELAGYERMEPSAPTTKTFASLLQRAKELEVPGA